MLQPPMCSVPIGRGAFKAFLGSKGAVRGDPAGRHLADIIQGDLKKLAGCGSSQGCSTLCILILT